MPVGIVAWWANGVGTRMNKSKCSEMNRVQMIGEGSCGINNQPQTRTMCLAGEVKGGRKQNQDIDLLERPRIQTRVWPKRGIGAQTNTRSSSRRGSRNLSLCLANREGKHKHRSLLFLLGGHNWSTFGWSKHARMGGHATRVQTLLTSNSLWQLWERANQRHRAQTMPNEPQKTGFFSQESNSTWCQPNSKSWRNMPLLNGKNRMQERWNLLKSLEHHLREELRADKLCI